MDYRVTNFAVLGKGVVLLRFASHVWMQVDFADLSAKGNKFRRLADDAYLAQGQIINDGSAVEWPDELDIGADSLWRRGEMITIDTAFDLFMKRLLNATD